MKNLHENVKRICKIFADAEWNNVHSGFCKRRRVHCFEMGYRLCGANEYVIVSKRKWDQYPGYVYSDGTYEKIPGLGQHKI